MFTAARAARPKPALPPACPSNSQGSRQRDDSGQGSGVPEAPSPSRPWWMGSIVGHCDAATAAPSNDEPILIQQADAAADPSKERIVCPGLLTEITQEVARLTNAEVFDGMTFHLQKSFSQTFGVGHGLTLGSSNAPGGTYQLTAHNASTDQKHVAVATMTQDKDCMIRLITTVGPFTGRIQGQVGQMDAGQLIVEHMGSDSASSITYGTGQLGLSFNQAITPRLAVGMDAQYITQGANKMPILTYGAKYTKPNDFSCTGALVQDTLTLQYVKRVSPRVQLGTELAYSVSAPNRNSFAVGAEVDLKPSKLHFSADGNGVINANMECRILPTASLVLCGQLNHAEDKHRFGFGMNMHAQ